MSNLAFGTNSETAFSGKRNDRRNLMEAWRDQNDSGQFQPDAPLGHDQLEADQPNDWRDPSGISWKVRT